MVCRSMSAVVLTLLALLVSACGAASSDSAKNFGGEAKAVATTIDDLAHAGSKRDGDQICSRYLASALVAKIKQSANTTCKSAIDQSLKDVDSFDLKVVKNGIKVNGNTATATVTSDSGTAKRTDILQLVKEPSTSGGKTTQVWKLSALAG